MRSYTSANPSSLRLTHYRARIAALVLLLAFLATSESGCRSSSADPGQQSDNEGAASLPSLDQVPTFDRYTDLSVDGAYRAIPHRRTQADFSASNVPAAERAYLSVAFAAIDQAVLLRVDTLRRFSAGSADQSRAVQRMGILIDFFSGITPPKRLVEYHKAVEQSLTSERAFFQEWQDHGESFQYSNPAMFAQNHNISAASSAARAAYGKLMALYPDESANNKDAFFDYHCALDFL
ncbi:MAG TPA: hypothetical protein VEZ90_07390 [Blastocatellia bacterium]|nr:hypothetical protein [Blastocatellia bacterium]